MEDNKVEKKTTEGRNGITNNIYLLNPKVNKKLKNK